MHGISASWHFASKPDCQKNSAWVSGNLTPSCFCNVTFFSEETYKFSESDCCTLVFSLLNGKLEY